MSKPILRKNIEKNLQQSAVVQYKLRALQSPPLQK